LGLAFLPRLIYGRHQDPPPVPQTTGWLLSVPPQCQLAVDGKSIHRATTVCGGETWKIKQVVWDPAAKNHAKI
jgi:hypothetical protein